MPVKAIHWVRQRACVPHGSPAGQCRVAFLIASKTSTTADGRVSAVVVAGDNLVVQPSPAIRIRDLSNAGFELDVDNNNMPDDWTQFPSNNTLSVGLSSQHSEGNLSILFDVDGGSKDTVMLASKSIGVTAGTTYRLSALMQANDGYLAEQHTNLDWQRDFYLGEATASGIYIEWFDDQGTPIQS